MITFRQWANFKEDNTAKEQVDAMFNQLVALINNLFEQLYKALKRNFQDKPRNQPKPILPSGDLGLATNDHIINIGKQLNEITKIFWNQKCTISLLESTNNIKNICLEANELANSGQNILIHGMNKLRNNPVTGKPVYSVQSVLDNMRKMLLQQVEKLKQAVYPNITTAPQPVHNDEAGSAVKAEPNQKIKPTTSTREILHIDIPKIREYANHFTDLIGTGIKFNIETPNGKTLSPKDPNWVSRLINVIKKEGTNFKLIYYKGDTPIGAKINYKQEALDLAEDESIKNILPNIVTLINRPSKIQPYQWLNLLKNIKNDRNKVADGDIAMLKSISDKAASGERNASPSSLWKIIDKYGKELFTKTKKIKVVKTFNILDLDGIRDVIEDMKNDVGMTEYMPKRTRKYQDIKGDYGSAIPSGEVGPVED